MSHFPEFDNAKLMIAASVKHCRNTIEDLPVVQIVVDEDGAIRSIDVPAKHLLGLEDFEEMRVLEIVADFVNVLPRRFSAATLGDLGVVQFLSTEKTELSARVVCVPGAHYGTFLLSVVFG